MSCLPAGFFDYEEDQLVAEGVSLKKQDLIKSKQENDEMSLFFGEVKELNSLEMQEKQDKEEYDNEKLKDEENDALQLAYMTKIAMLYKKSDSIVNKKKLNKTIEEDLSSNIALIEANELVSSILVAESSSSIDRGNSKKRNSNNDIDISAILMKKKKDKKKKLEDLENKSFVPIDSSNLY
jgi:hypothetical protein